MKNLAVSGTEISPWEAEVLVDIIEEVYFNDTVLREIKEGQVKKNCVSLKEGPGKELKDCELATVIYPRVFIFIVLFFYFEFKEK